MSLDKRLLKIEIEIGGEIKSYTDLDISASGSKVSNEIPNGCTIKINNLSKDVRNKILTENNILDKSLTNKKIKVFAGRESRGYSLVFSGDIRQITTSQPPDIALTIVTYTGDAKKLENISRTGGELIKLSILSKQIANGLGLILFFQATDKQIGSYSYVGSRTKEIEKLNQINGIDAYIDDDTLIVKNSSSPLIGSSINISKLTGMIGIPQINERGLNVKILFNENVKIGSQINLTSELNINANGSWLVYKITYDLQNRNQSFYMTLDCTKI